MGSIYRESGLANAPAFFSYTPFRLDFSPYRRNQELMMQMMPMLLEQQQQTAAAAKAKKMPELDGLANDVTPRYERAMAAKAGMSARMNAGMNPMWVAKNDPEFQQHQQDYLQAISPADQLRLKEEKEKLDTFEKAVQSRVAKGEAAGDFVFTDAKGIPQLDPEDPTSFLSVGDFNTRRRYFPDYDVDGHGGYLKADGQLVSPQDFTERFDKLINTDALKEWGGPGAAQASLDPMTNLVSIVQRSQRGHSNQDQLQAGLALASKQFDTSAELGLFNAYKQTDHFSKNREKYLNDGQLDWNLVRQGMLSGGGFGDKGKQSFSDSILMDIADKHLRKANLVTESRSTIKNGKAGAGGSDAEDIPFWQYVGNGIPHTVMDPATGKEVDAKRLMRREEVTVPIPVQKNGQIAYEGKKTEVYSLGLPPDAKQVLKNELLGLPKVENSQNYLSYDDGSPDQFKLASEVAAGTVAVTAGGKELTEDQLAHMRVVGGGDKLQFRPALWGSDNVNLEDILNGRDERIKYGNVQSDKGIYTDPTIHLDGEGSSVFSETWVPVEVQVDEDAEMTDFVPDGPSQNNLALKLKEQSLTGWSDPGIPTFSRNTTDLFGGAGGRTTIYMRMPDSWKYPNGPSNLRVNPKRFMNILSNQDRASAAGTGAISVEDNINEVLMQGAE